MYFLQHLLFPGKLVSAETDPTCSSGKANPKSIAELPQHLQDRVKQLPDSLIHLLFQLQDLPAISSPDEFPADFPIQQIPDEFRPPGELSAALHRILQSLDPAMAERWHWRDIRKVRRSVEVALQTGMPHSEIMAQQKQVEPVAECVPLRYCSSVRTDAPSIQIPDSHPLALLGSEGPRASLRWTSGEDAGGMWPACTSTAHS